jgi:hypothetical protein
VGGGGRWGFLYDARTEKAAVVQRPGRPGPGGGTFLRGERQCPVINNRGEIAFHASVGSHETGEPVPGVFARFGDETVLVAREGTPAPGGGHFQAAEYPAVNDAGEVVFHAVTTGSDGLGVYRWRDGSITAVAGPGTPIRGRRRLEHAFYPQIDGNGGVVFLGQTRRGTGLYRWAGGTIQPIAEPRGFLPGLGPMMEIEFNGRRPFALNAAGAAAFIARGAAHTGVFVWEQGKVKLVAISDATLPPVGLVTQVGTPFGQGDGYRPPGVPYGYAPPPGVPYGYAPPPGSIAPGSSGPPGVPPGYSRPYGGPGRGYGPSGRSFGVGLSNNGKVAFLAAIDGEPCLLLATLKPARESTRVARQ